MKQKNKVLILNCIKITTMKGVEGIMVNLRVNQFAEKKVGRVKTAAS